jgi:hypothetical protein
MKQNGASFCRPRFSIPSKIAGPAPGASALNGRQMSLERALRRRRSKINALHRNDLRRRARENILTKSKKPSSARGFCLLVANRRQTKWASPPAIRYDGTHVTGGKG